MSSSRRHIRHKVQLTLLRENHSSVCTEKRARVDCYPRDKVVVVTYRPDRRPLWYHIVETIVVVVLFPFMGMVNEYFHDRLGLRADEVELLSVNTDHSELVVREVTNDMTLRIRAESEGALQDLLGCLRK
jgi:hypothetical protein